jgi:hypothetical protein
VFEKLGIYNRVKLAWYIYDPRSGLGWADEEPVRQQANIESHSSLAKDPP